MGHLGKKPMRDNERALVDLLSSLDTKYPDILIIVEGRRDVNILRDLGVGAEIVRTQTWRSRDELVQRIVNLAADRQVLILTDFDEEGIEMARFLKKNLEYHKVRMLNRLRIRIRNLMGNWRCIEEIKALFKRLDAPEPA